MLKGANKTKSRSNKLRLRFVASFAYAYNSLAKRNILGQRHRIVIVLLVVIHPDLGGTSCISGKDIATAAGEGVRMTLAEHMANTTAGYYLQAATTLPHPERDFQILTAPHIHLHIVFAQLIEVRLIDDKQPSRNHGRAYGSGWIIVPGRTLRGAQIFPFEYQIPIETAAQIRRGANILKVVHANHIDDGAYHTRGILTHTFQEWLQPLLVALHVAVEEGQNAANGCIGTAYTRSD